MLCLLNNCSRCIAIENNRFRLLALVAPSRRIFASPQMINMVIPIHLFILFYFMFLLVVLLLLRFVLSGLCIACVQCQTDVRE